MSISTYARYVSRETTARTSHAGTVRRLAMNADLWAVVLPVLVAIATLIIMALTAA